MALVRNTRTGKHPIVLHATGRNGRSGAWALLCQEVMRLHAASPPQEWHNYSAYELFTWSTFEPGQTCLERCCKAMGVPLTVRRAPEPGVWRNITKIPLTVEFLQRCKADYVIGLDALDVLLLDHPSDIVFRFQTQFEPQGTRLLFNAAMMPWPRRTGLPSDACMGFELQKFDERDRHLNAGAWVGRRDYALEFWQGVLDMIEHDWPHEVRNSEQIAVRAAAFPDHYPKLDIDRQCRIFQHMEGGKKDLEGLHPALTSSMVCQPPPVPRRTVNQGART